MMIFDFIIFLKKIKNKKQFIFKKYNLKYQCICFPKVKKEIVRNIYFIEWIYETFTGGSFAHILLFNRSNKEKVGKAT